MVKGSTPTFTLKLPVHTDIVNAITVIFVQDNGGSLMLDTERMTFDGYFVTFQLEEWETLEFTPGVIADLQFTFATTDGNVYVSEIRKVAVRKKYPEDIT